MSVTKSVPRVRIAITRKNIPKVRISPPSEPTELPGDLGFLQAGTLVLSIPSGFPTELRAERLPQSCPPNHRNQQYSVTALTDTTGTISERYAYDAYGKLTVFDGGGTVLSGSAYGNRYTYTGREWDSDLGLYHYRARMYSADTGRFVSRDPIRYKGGVNLFSYLQGNSVSRTDPLGLFGILPPMGGGTFFPKLHPWYRNTAVWPMFEHYFYGKGEDFDLGEHGLLDNFQNSRQISDQVTDYENWLRTYANLKASSLWCNKYPGANNSLTFSHSQNFDYEFGGDSKLQNGIYAALYPLFALGGPLTADSFSVTTECHISLDQCGRCCNAFVGLFVSDDWHYTLSCSLKYKLKDKFIRPYDVNDSAPDSPADVPPFYWPEPNDSNPTPFNIVASWSNDFSETFTRPCPGKDRTRFH